VREEGEGLEDEAHIAVLRGHAPHGLPAGMYMNKFDMLFFSPNISFSLSQNADFSLVGQLFSGNLPNPITQQNERKLFTLIFLRLKYSF
jgi:hypothetical protein